MLWVRTSKVYTIFFFTVWKGREILVVVCLYSARSSQFREPSCTGNATAFCVLGIKLSCFVFRTYEQPPAERIGGENIGNQMLKVS